MLKIGIVGSSQGNGHPFSWSAIVNGFNTEFLARIPFASIQKYLPLAPFIGDEIDARVVCVWDEDKDLAETVAAVANIPIVAETLDQLVQQVDVVLHARDDYWNHMNFLEYYATQGKPVFLDKPIATTRENLSRIFVLDPSLTWLFSASALAWDPSLGGLRDSKSQFISAVAPKDWERYSIHLIEPILSILGYPEVPFQSQCRRFGQATLLSVDWDDGRAAEIQTTGLPRNTVDFVVDGISFEIGSPAQAFAACLRDFVRFARGHRVSTRVNELEQIVSLVERGV